MRNQEAVAEETATVAGQSAPSRINWFHIKKALITAIGAQARLGTKAKLAISILLFAVSFSIRSIHAVDLQPLMYTKDEPGRGMSGQYDQEASWIFSGRGILVPDDWGPSDTSLLVHAPGYPMFLAAIYTLDRRSYFYAQLVQNIVNSFGPVIMFLLAGELLSWPVGIVSGVLAAGSHHLAYFSNLILPDSVCALPLLAAMYFLVKARRRQRRWALYTLSGLMIGVSIWLRPNALLIGPFVAVILVILARDRRREFKRAWIVAAVPILTIAPITIRNYLLFHQFVLISANTGIVMLEGVANASEGRFGPLPGDDKQVGHMESIWYNDPRYEHGWAEPDGIKRDRDRVKRSLSIIIRHPVWFAGSMLGRMRDMLSYVADADLVRRQPPPPPEFSPEGQLLLFREYDLKTDVDTGLNFSANRRTVEFCLAFGHALNWARAGTRTLERITKETSEPMILLGLPFVLFLSVRRGLLLLAIPLYYLLVQSTLHTEFRYTLPMHYFLFVFAATVWVIIGWCVWSLVARGRRRFKRSAETSL
ncbi:MAG TPA: glycosyltransferase family 39 protein [Blastocatellia bacterium]